MLSRDSTLTPLTANLSCFAAMFTWSVGFPAADVLLQSWGAISLISTRQLLGVAPLLIAWVLIDGWRQVASAPWKRGLGVGGLGFGLGAILLLVGQQLSDPVTPAVAAAMMPIAGALLEVVFDNRRLRPMLMLAIILVLLGGYLATGMGSGEATFELGALLCLVAVFLFAWATRMTTHHITNLSPIGKTTITLMGGTIFIWVTYIVYLLANFPGIEIGIIDTHNIILLLIFSVASLGIAQLMWIWGASKLGILVASFHMNAVPFYVMVIMVVLFGNSWSWTQTSGALLVAIGVLLSQLRYGIVQPYVCNFGLV
ncbi:MAG: EamA family transporter [Gammaproteobacteria bacterium]|nr:EamA family transporter [Gammaproteobacteria bacterium]